MKRLIVAIAATALIACGKHDQGADRPAPSADAYTVKGKVTRLPGPGAKDVEVETERIPDFKGADGKVSAMDPMPMPYAVTDGVSLDGVAVGDPVQITFEVHWKDDPALRLTKITKLPAGTKLQVP